MSKILVLHGPNLNLLGTREPEYYGQLSLSEINFNLEELAKQHYIEIECRQSNSESGIVNWIQQAADNEFEFIVINPAAYTHSSVAIRDALTAVQIPFVEVHLSNIYCREPFRAHSYLSDIAEGVISGLGHLGYEYACLYACMRIKCGKNNPYIN